MKQWGEKVEFQEQNHARRNWIRYTAELAGLADALQQQKSLQELTRLGMDERTLEAMLYMLQVMTPPAVAMSQDKYMWIGPRSDTQELLEFEMTRRWLSYGTSLKTGNPAGQLEPWLFQVLSEQMHTTAKEMVPEITRYVQQHVLVGQPGLDIGGNHGLFAEALHESGYPMTVVDLPYVVAHARKSNTNLSFLGCDVVKEAPVTNKDFRFGLMIRFLRMLGPNQIEKAIQHISSVVQDDARLIVVDAIRGISLNADMIAINMILNTPAGNIYTLDQLQNLLRPWKLEDMSEISDENVLMMWRLIK